MTATLDELAARFDCRVLGDGATVVNRVATLSGATSDAVTFLANPLYREHLKSTEAAAVILESSMADDCPVASLVSSNPYVTYARVAGFLHPPAPARAGIHDTASVASDAHIAESSEVGPMAVIGSGASVGARSIVGSGTVIGAGVRVGEDTRLAPRVTLLDHVRVGDRCILHSGVIVGADGFGFARDETVWIKVPQIGSVNIGNDVEIGANTTIDRGTMEDTVIEDGVKIDNLCQIAHNVRVGAHTVMAAMSGAAGSTTIGRRCMLGGGVVMVGHLTICDDAVFTFRSVVTKSVSAPGTYGGSLPAEEASKWRRNAARFRALDRLQNRLSSLERKLEQSTMDGIEQDDD